MSEIQTTKKKSKKKKSKKTKKEKKKKKHDENNSKDDADHSNVDEKKEETLFDEQKHREQVNKLFERSAEKETKNDGIKETENKDVNSFTENNDENETLEETVDDITTSDNNNKNDQPVTVANVEQEQEENIIMSLTETSLAESNDNNEIIASTENINVKDDAQEDIINLGEENDDQKEEENITQIGSGEFPLSRNPTEEEVDKSTAIGSIESEKFPLSKLFDSAVDNDESGNDNVTANNIKPSTAEDSEETKELKAILESPEHQKVIQGVKEAQKRANKYIYKTRVEKAKEEERITKEKAILLKRKMDLDYKFKPKVVPKNTNLQSRISPQQHVSTAFSSSAVDASYDDVISSSIFNAAQNLDESYIYVYYKS